MATANETEVTQMLTDEVEEEIQLNPDSTLLKTSIVPSMMGYDFGLSCAKYEDFLPTQYDMLYPIYLAKLFPSLFHVLTPNGGEKKYPGENKLTGLNYVLHRMCERDEGLSVDDLHAIQLAIYEERVEMLCKSIFNKADPWLFRCLLDELYVKNNAYYRTVVRPSINRITRSHYCGLINSVCRYGHTLALSASDKLNIHDTHDHKSRFVDIRKWIGPTREIPTTEGVCMTIGEFIKFVGLLEPIARAMEVHGLHAKVNPRQALEEEVIPKKWKISGRLTVILTGVDNLLPGEVPGATIFGRGKHAYARDYLQLSTPGKFRKDCLFFKMIVNHIERIWELTDETLTSFYTGRKKYVSLM